MSDQPKPLPTNDMTAFLAALVIAHAELARSVQAILRHDQLDEELRATLRRDVVLSMQEVAHFMEQAWPGSSDEVMKRYLKPVGP